MNLNHARIGAFAAALAFAVPVASPAAAATDGHKYIEAINACSLYNEYQPVELVTAADSISGYSLVWLTDVDGYLWMCHADDNGNIDVYEPIGGDLLEGTGSILTSLEFVSHGESKDDPQAVAEQVCVMAAFSPVTVIESRPDGLSGDWISGYSVFLEDSAGNQYLCNATGDAAIWAWASIGDSLEFPGEAVS